MHIFQGTVFSDCTLQMLAWWGSTTVLGSVLPDLRQGKCTDRILCNRCWTN